MFYDGQKLFTGRDAWGRAVSNGDRAWSGVSVGLTLLGISSLGEADNLASSQWRASRHRLDDYCTVVTHARACFTADIGMAHPATSDDEASAEWNTVWIVSAVGVGIIGGLKWRQARKRRQQELAVREQTNPLPPDHDGDRFFSDDLDDLWMPGERSAEIEEPTGAVSVLDKRTTTAQSQPAQGTHVMRKSTSTTTPRPTLWLLGTLLLSLFCLFKAAPAMWFGADQNSKPVYQAGGVTYGLKSVADYRVDDEIYAYNHDTGRLEVRRVAQVFERKSDHLRVLTVRALDGSTRTIPTTDEHPFYGAEQGGYVAAKELLAGQQFRCMDGSLQTLVKTVREDRPDGVTVYNLEVEGLHNYFVAPLGNGNAPVLAHNRCDWVDEAIEGGELGAYSAVGGHHIHAKAAFKAAAQYTKSKGFSISREFMEKRGWRHKAMTTKQRELFNELARSGRPNTLREHTRIAVEALEAGGATTDEARSLVAESLRDLRAQGVRFPTNIPWN